MYFDVEPKSRREDLFDFEEEYLTLKNSILRGKRIIVIKGIRRTGKTSLMKVVYNEIDVPKVFLDGRIITPRQSDILLVLFEGSINAVTDYFLDLKIKDVLKELGISFGINLRISMSTGLRSFEKLDEFLENRNKKLILFLDEVQRLKAGNISGIIAHLYEHTRNIVMVIAGSEVGLLDEIIGRYADSDLYGRPKRVIELGRLKREKSIEFLKLGFAECKKKVDMDSIEEAVDVLDGIIGWLTLFGYYSMRYGMGKSLEMVRKEGAKIVAKEIEHFLEVRKDAKNRYLRILEALAIPLRWVEVKRILESMEGREVNDKMVSKYLRELMRYGFIEKREERYAIADPMIREGVVRVARR